MPVADQPEYILCAAIHYTDEPTPDHCVDNVEGLVLCGHRHPQIIGQYKKLTGKDTKLPQAVQGFLTSKNRFATREAAVEIARNAAQIDSNTTKPKLYSEDLY